MSARWQFPFFVSAWCAAFVGGPFGGAAWSQYDRDDGANPRMSQGRSQCNQGGSLNPRMSQGLIAQQQMLQQQLLQQQQQMLQMAKLDRQMRELAKEGPEAIKTALKDPNAEMRLIAVLTVAKYGPPLTDDLIERLTDDNASVRQAARGGLVSLSTQRDGKPGKRRSVDFGPATNANRSLQESAARKWRTWFERRQKRKEDLKAVAVKPAAPPVVAPKQNPPAAPDAAVAIDEPGLLTKQLVEATPAQSDEVVSKLRDGKGAVYTQALAGAIPQMSGIARDKAREALAERLTRMTAATLHDKLSDENPEVRRAAALACAMKESASHVPDLIVLLEDPAPAVPPAACAALKSLTNQDFGAISRSDTVQQQRVVAAWKAWWQKQGGG